MPASSPEETQHKGLLLSFQVSDSENILGIVQVENIQILAEAYDVALDISFPKGGWSISRLRAHSGISQKEFSG